MAPAKLRKYSSKKNVVIVHVCIASSFCYTSQRIRCIPDVTAAHSKQYIPQHVESLARRSFCGTLVVLSFRDYDFGWCLRAVVTPEEILRCFQFVLWTPIMVIHPQIDRGRL